jgi:NADH-quinone oxidoreductase subunit D
METSLLFPPGFQTTAQGERDTEAYFLNMGPQHPSTHGVLRLVIKLDGENVLKVVPHLGYIHRGIEKMGENQTYLQYLHLTDRMDYLSSFMNNLSVCLAVERALGMGVPERAEYIRVMICELQRLQSHLLWWGVFGMDLGAISTFLYGFRDREEITMLFEEVCGARLTMNYFRPGGCFADVPDTFVPRVRKIIEMMKHSLDEFDRLLSGNIIMLERTRGVGIMSRELAIQYGCSGPTARASGVDYDVRRNDPYSIYDRFEFRVPLGAVGDCHDRYRVRMEEMAESVKILEQACATFPAGPYRSKEKPIIKLPAGAYFQWVESARGAYGTYIVSDGGTKPYRIKTRSPSFSNLSVIDEITRGVKIADLVTIMSTLDIVVPDIDR